MAEEKDKIVEEKPAKKKPVIDWKARRLKAINELPDAAKARKLAKKFY